MIYNANELFKKIKSKVVFDEEKHGLLMLTIMGDANRGRLSSFCAEVGVSDKTVYNWMKQSEIFLECYALGKLLARENWEYEGMRIREEVTEPGTSNHLFEHWRMVGWSRFGVGKNSRIRLDLDPNGTPNEHYQQLMHQSSQGDFTASEIKQLMEAINVGLTVHQVETLQKEIDKLKQDLQTMNENSNVNNTFTG